MTFPPGFQQVLLSNHRIPKPSSIWKVLGTSDFQNLRLDSKKNLLQNLGFLVQLPDLERRDPLSPGFLWKEDDAA